MLSSSQKRRWPTLHTIGIAAEHYPAYVNRRLRLHSLDVVLLSFIVRGRGKHVIDDATFEEGGGSLAITHYGQRHDILTDRQGMEVINVYLDLQSHPLPVLPPELQKLLPFVLPLHPRFQHRLNRIVRLQFAEPHLLAAPLFTILRELENREPGHEEMILLHFRAFLLLCCRHVLLNGILPVTGLAGPNQRVEAARQYLDTAFAEPHTLDGLAGRFQMSGSYFCRSFKAHTGKRLFDYLIERRVQAAMVRLRSSDEKVLQVALECGFNDLSYFNRKFKSLVGCCPSLYRASTHGQR